MGEGEKVCADRLRFMRESLVIVCTYIFCGSRATYLLRDPCATIRGRHKKTAQRQMQMCAANGSSELRAPHLLTSAWVNNTSPVPGTATYSFVATTAPRRATGRLFAIMLQRELLMEPMHEPCGARSVRKSGYEMRYGRRHGRRYAARYQAFIGGARRALRKSREGVAPRCGKMRRPACCCICRTRRLQSFTELRAPQIPIQHA